MKLYMKPGACSLASHIALREAGLPFTLDQVDTDAGTTGDGGDYRAVNPKGYVPALALDTGEVLTEGASVLQYIADQRPESGLAPAAGTLARARLHEHLNYVASELHKAFGPFFSSAASDEQKQAAHGAVAGRFDYLETLFADGRDHLLGETFTVADAYMFVVSNWANFVGIDLSRWPNVQAFVGRVATRPSVQAAMVAEGLIPAERQAS